MILLALWELFVSEVRLVNDVSETGMELDSRLWSLAVGGITLMDYGKDEGKRAKRKGNKCRSSTTMTTVAKAFIGLFWLPRLVCAVFPEEPGPLNFIPTEVVRRYPVFLGRPHHSSLRQEPLHIQRILQVNRTLYIGARDDLFRLELDNVVGEEMFYSKAFLNMLNCCDHVAPLPTGCCLSNGATLADTRRDECRNYMKVLLSRQGGLFICGTNAFNPLCANYTGDTLEMVAETVSGMARCPYDPKHANVALFA
ncbi:hypothetical protein cypCar_00006809, partial [Cyprinus carpio]